MGATSELSLKPPDVRVRKTLRIGVSPAHARSARPRLFAALEAAYPVRFEDHQRAGQGDEPDALLAFGAQPPAGLPAAVPVLQAIGDERRGDGGSTQVALSGAAELARPLRDARLSDDWSGPLADASVASGQLVLGTVGDVPAWVLAHDPVASGAGSRQLVSVAPAELEAGESLRERLVPGRCLALLALANFLQDLTRDLRPAVRSPRAAFVLDDPNLHWPNYGYLRYEELARHAREHGYHLAVAMTPLDGWFAHPSAVQTFKKHPTQLSICVHGNDHLGPELGRIATDRQGFVLARHALARAGAFERRTGIPYERVMIPPHEQLSEPAARGLRAGGFEAVCVSRPYPWIHPRRPGSAAALGAGPPERGALTGWAGREIVAGGLPSLPRTGFNAPREDLVLRAFLGQPLILYAHHDLLEHGLEVLAQAAATVDALGDVRWASLSHIARDGGPPLKPNRLPAPSAAPRPRARPLLRRLASEARDRARIG
jgi:hypothetical protein